VVYQLRESLSYRAYTPTVGGEVGVSINPDDGVTLNMN